MTTVELEGRPAFVAQRRRDALSEVAATLATIVVAVLLGALIIALTGKNAGEALHVLLTGPLQRTSRIGNWLEITTTLALLGLSVVIPFRARQISIGAEGQLYLGALCGALVAIYVPLPAVLSGVGATVVAMLAGGLAGAIPGLMKSRWGANEVVSTIMLNVVVVQIFEWTLNHRLKSPTQIAPVSQTVQPGSAWPKLTEIFGVPFGRANIGLFIVIGLAFAVWVLIERTPLGYRMRVVGANEEFARYGGISVPPVIDWSFILGGSLAGLAGAHLLLGVYGRLEPGMASGLAFLGILVSLLARNNPLSVIIAAAFYAYLQVGGAAMEQQTSVGSELVTCIQAVIVLLITARLLPNLIKHLTRHKAGS